MSGCLTIDILCNFFRFEDIFWGISPIFQFKFKQKQVGLRVTHRIMDPRRLL